MIDLGRTEEALFDWQSDLAANPVEHDAWYGYAELCLFLGKDREYQRACRDLLQRFEGSSDPQVCERTGRACLLGELTDDEVRRATVLVERAVDADRALSPGWAYPCFKVAQGLARYRRGDWEGAIRDLEGEASGALGPLPHLVLAMANYRAGRAGAAWKSFATAIDAYDWDVKRADIVAAWIYHSVRREAEHLLLPELQATLSGQHGIEGKEELAAVSAVCRSSPRALTITRLLADSFRTHPSLADDLTTDLRYSAACAAARAGTGIGEDSTESSESERARWREQARCWLTDDLRARAAHLENPSSSAPRTLATWLTDPRLAGLREPSALEPFSAREREECLALWREVREVSANVQPGVPRARD